MSTIPHDVLQTLNREILHLQLVYCIVYDDHVLQHIVCVDDILAAAMYTTIISSTYQGVLQRLNLVYPMGIWYSDVATGSRKENVVCITRGEFLITY